MDRTVPSSGNEEINLYLRTYYSLLRSTREVQIKTLIEAHKRMHSALHIEAEEPMPDMAAFIYAILRMPSSLDQLRLIIMGQSDLVFAQHGFPDVETWQQVSAPGRRRRSFFDGKDQLAVYIASRSDIDDIVPILTAYQIERSKLRRLLNQSNAITLLDQMDQKGGIPSDNKLGRLAHITDISVEDFQRLAQIWKESTVKRLLRIVHEPQELSIRSLAGSLADYKRATRRWWINVTRKTPDISYEDRPVYFVSSNTHSLTNLVSGFALKQEQALHNFIHENGDDDLKQEYHDILESNVPSNHENFLYYGLKKLESARPDIQTNRLNHEKSLGIIRAPSSHAFDVEAQIVDLKQLQPEWLDPRLRLPGIEALRQSNALIINIDYPLGMAAGRYRLFRQLSGATG